MSGSSSINYFNNIFTNQLLQQQFNNTIAQNNSQIQQNNQNTSQLGSAINSLSNLLASSNKTSAASSYQLSSLDAYTMKREMFANLRTIQIFARQILIALQKLHQLHIAHTDLKPENILIKSYTNRTLKVIDVGSSVFFHD